MGDYERAASPMDTFERPVKAEEHVEARRDRSPSRSRSRSRSPKREVRDSRSRSRSPVRRSTSRRHSPDRRTSRRRSPSPSRSRDRRRRSISPRRRSRSPRQRRRSPLPAAVVPRGISGGRTEANKEFHGTRDEPEMSNILGVFGLSLRTREIDLEEVFREFGTIEKVTIVYDHRSNRSRGFGFVYFKDQGEATRARDALNGMDIDDRKIRVDYSVTHRPHTPTPGEYMGERKMSHDNGRDDRRGGGGGSGGGSGGGYDRDRRSNNFRDRGRRRSRSRSPERRRRYYRSRSRSWSR